MHIDTQTNPATTSAPGTPTAAAAPALTGTPLSVAAFKRELRPGRRFSCVHRNQQIGAIPAGKQPPNVRTVTHVGSRDLEVNAPDLAHDRAFLTYPTQKSGSWLEQTATGFIFAYASGLRCVYQWLD
ncbi:hypothetical protein [Deinococcus ruber]|uniref:Uncharacterized protein n=1 Tax=Deinococcus ruber TaxID=1848197 RepID=A0A918FAU4_9DEIO|nr:hypothetical protein [Deinococcus ruber]GGR17129.1 hypothetical protein GCM10008957_32160 [Deinococcus ruber]